MQSSSTTAAGIALMQAADQLLADHEILMRGLDCHQEWIRQLSEIGMPRFGELASRLRVFRNDLEQHFRAEENCSQMLHAATEETTENDPNGNRLHSQLLDRLNTLTQRLTHGLDEFTGWNAAVDEVRSLIAEICEHERREMDALRKVRSIKPPLNPGS
jgi:hypothetical protein